jgi:hypothetical protein
MSAFRSCCDRRSATDACGCNPWYCRRCKLCAFHCRCETPWEWVDAGDELDEEDIEAPAGTGHTLAYQLLPEVIAAGRAFGSVVYTRVLYSAGETAGAAGEPRDWTMPDEWHRGYLQGRLKRLKGEGENMNDAEAVTPDAIADGSENGNR